jgi:hypothetical protein
VVTSWPSVDPRYPFVEGHLYAQDVRHGVYRWVCPECAAAGGETWEQITTSPTYLTTEREIFERERIARATLEVTAWAHYFQHHADHPAVAAERDRWEREELT